jgi:hypothetical protein
VVEAEILVALVTADIGKVEHDILLRFLVLLLTALKMWRWAAGWVLG